MRIRRFAFRIHFALRDARIGRANLTKNVTTLSLLQFAPRVPWPLDTGSKLRVYHLAQALATKMSVTLLAFGAERPQQSTGPYKRVLTVPRDENYSVSNMVRGAIGPTPLPVLNYSKREMSVALSRLLGEYKFHLIQVESMHLLNYLPLIRNRSQRTLVVCNWHNVESDLMRQYAERERNPARRTYARRTARLMQRAEQLALKEFDAHIAVSDADRKRLHSIDPNAQVFVIENGVEAASYKDEQSVQKNCIVFVASMDYHANIDAAKHFARDVWPQLHQQRPELRFTVVGRNPSAEVEALASQSGIEVTGSVDDVRPYYRSAIAAVVPLNVGGGSRLKILEAMAAGVPVVSTRLGAEGLDVTDGENILLVDSPAQFIEAMAKVFDDTALRERLIRNGEALIHARYDWSMLGVKLQQYYESLLL